MKRECSVFVPNAKARDANSAFYLQHGVNESENPGATGWNTTAIVRLYALDFDDLTVCLYHFSFQHRALVQFQSNAIKLKLR